MGSQILATLSTNLSQGSSLAYSSSALSFASRSVSQVRCVAKTRESKGREMLEIHSIFRIQSVQV